MTARVKIFRPLLVAIQLLTCIPLSLRSAPSADDLRWASVFFPIVGLLIGLSGASVYKASAALVPPSAALTIAMLAIVILTGGLHEDGLADCADGFAGGRDRERVLDIMRDSRIGTFGALALLFAVLLKFTLLASLTQSDVVRGLIMAPVVSRYLVLPLALVLRPARADGLGRTFAAHVGSSQTWLGAVSVAIVGALMYHRAFLALAAASCSAVAIFGWYCHRRIGGITGDCFGAAIQVAEITTYLAVAAIARP